MIQRVLIVLLLAVGMSCARYSSRRHPVADCPRTEPNAITSTDTTSWPRLAGRWRLILVDTVNPRIAPWARVVELAPPDSTFLEQWEQSRRQNAAVGERQMAPPKLVGVEHSAGNRQLTAQWLVYATGMMAGWCGGLCGDGVTTYFNFELWPTTGTRGTWWQTSTGIGAPIDPEIRRTYRTPAGYFCIVSE